MSLSAAVIRELVAAGLAGDALVTACERIEAATPDVELDTRTPRQKRNARYYDRKASEKRLKASYSDVSDADVLSPKKETSPEPPKEKTTPIRETDAREFDEVFWPAYPLKRGKPEALKAFRAARKRAGLDAIMAGVQRYAAERLGEDKQFTKHAQGWLNGDHWTDEPVPRRQPKQANAPPETVGSLSLKQLVSPRNEIDVTDYSERRLENGGSGRLEAGASAAQAFTITGDLLGSF